MHTGMIMHGGNDGSTTFYDEFDGFWYDRTDDTTVDLIFLGLLALFIHEVGRMGDMKWAGVTRVPGTERPIRLGFVAGDSMVWVMRLALRNQ